jgi:hypothetical protein
VKYSCALVDVAFMYVSLSTGRRSVEKVTPLLEHDKCEYTATTASSSAPLSSPEPPVKVILLIEFHTATPLQVVGNRLTASLGASAAYVEVAELK